MASALATLLTLAWLAAGPDPGGSYLLVADLGPDGAPRTRAIAYYPSQGDIVLFDDHSRTWRFLYKMVGSDVPDHSGMVVRLPDGRPALLESGPDDGKLAGPYVRLLEAVPRLHQFQGTMYVRRLRCPLSPAQSAALTNFAIAQEGKRYALGRLLLQATPFRCRSGLRAKVFGHTYMDRCSWLCSELVVAAGTAAGLFDPKVHHANRIYPLDMFQDTKYDLSGTWEKPALWGPTASASGAPPNSR